MFVIAFRTSWRQQRKFKGTALSPKVWRASNTTIYTNLPQEGVQRCVGVSSTVLSKKSSRSKRTTVYVAAIRHSADPRPKDEDFISHKPLFGILKLTICHQHRQDIQIQQSIQKSNRKVVIRLHTSKTHGFAVESRTKVSSSAQYGKSPGFFM